MAIGKLQQQKVAAIARLEALAKVLGVRAVVKRLVGPPHPARRATLCAVGVRQLAEAGNHWSDCIGKNCRGWWWESVNEPLVERKHGSASRLDLHCTSDLITVSIRALGRATNGGIRLSRKAGSAACIGICQLGRSDAGRGLWPH